MRAMHNTPQSQGSPPDKISWRYPIALAIGLPVIEVGRDLVSGKPDNYFGLLALAIFAFALGLGVEYITKRRGRSS
jgi:hypothetical protein